MDSLKQNNINLPTFNNLENKLQEELQKSSFDISGNNKIFFIYIIINIKLIQWYILLYRFNITIINVL